MAAIRDVPMYLTRLKNKGEINARKSRNGNTGEVVGRYIASCNQAHRREWLDELAQHAIPVPLLGEILAVYRRTTTEQHLRTIRNHAEGRPLVMREDGCMLFRKGQ